MVYQKNDSMVYIQNSMSRDSYNNNENTCFCVNGEHQNTIDANKSGPIYSGGHDDVLTDSIDMEKILSDERVKSLLNKNYIPTIDETKKNVVKNIKKYYSDNIEMIYEGEELSKYLNGQGWRLF